MELSCSLPNAYQFRAELLHEVLSSDEALAPCTIRDHGFNRSAWTQYGVVDHYQSLQDGLEDAIQRQLDVVDTGYDVGSLASPPIGGEYPKP